MAPFFYKKWYYRLIFGLVAGLLTWLLTEVMLNIRYRYFIMFIHPVNYAYAAAFGIVILESVFRTGLLFNKWQSWEKAPGKRLLLQILAGVVIATFWVIVVRLSFSYFLSPGKLIIFEDELIILSLVILIIISLSLVEFGVFLNERYRKSLAEVERFRKENAEYQFEMLKLQLNPHFLFNSLNTLSSVIYEDRDKAAEFIRRLSEVYRYVLDNRNKELVTVKEELEFIHSFTFLLGLRFQGMINFQFDIIESTFGKKIAPMTMQLLVENAVKHNVASGKSPLNISISTDPDKLTVQNNLQLKEKQPGTGTGLKNISSRYEFLTDKKVEIISDDHQFKVTIPLIN